MYVDIIKVLKTSASSNTPEMELDLLWIQKK